HTPDRAGHANRLVTDKACICDHVTMCVEIHVRSCGCRRFFAVVDETRDAISRADEHESAATQISCLRMHYRERKADGNGGIYGIPARLHDLCSGAGGQFVNTGDHGMWSVNSMYGGSRESSCD